MAQLHFVLRFAFGTTLAFVVCEWMDWQPSALAPVLAGMLLANLPACPPPKLGVVLIVVMAAAAWFSFFLTTFLSQVPHLLFASIGIVIFFALLGLAQSKAQLPLTLLLICITVVPVITLTVAQWSGTFPSLLVRSMMLAVLATWAAYAVWPTPSPRAPDPPAPRLQFPVASAALGTAIILPVMLVYMLFGITDAVPVLLTVVLLIAKMEEERGAANARAKLSANFLGGFVAVAAYFALEIVPTLATLALITFVIGVAFAAQIAKGGVAGGNALLAYNATIVIFGLALLKGPQNAGTWGARVVQFTIACTFAVGMMTLLWPRRSQVAKLMSKGRSS